MWSSTIFRVWFDPAKLERYWLIVLCLPPKIRTYESQRWHVFDKKQLDSFQKGEREALEDKMKSWTEYLEKRDVSFRDGATEEKKVPTDRLLVPKIFKICTDNYALEHVFKRLWS